MEIHSPQSSRLPLRCLSAVIMLLGAGAAVDFVETNNTLTVLQGATDAAAIAAGSSGNH